jgi:hypothetical protein
MLLELKASTDQGQRRNRFNKLIQMHLMLGLSILIVRRKTKPTKLSCRTHSRAINRLTTRLLKSTFKRWNSMQEFSQPNLNLPPHFKTTSNRNSTGIWALDKLSHSRKTSRNALTFNYPLNNPTRGTLLWTSNPVKSRLIEKSIRQGYSLQNPRRLMMFSKCNHKISTLSTDLNVQVQKLDSRVL